VAEHCVHGFKSIIYKQGKRTIEQKVTSICELQNVIGKMSLVQLKKSTKRSFELRTKKKFQLESLSSKRSRTVANGDNDSTGGPVAKKSKRSGRKEKKAKRSPKSKKTKSSKEVAAKFIRRSGRLTKKADMLDMSEPLVDQESVEDNEDDQFGIGKAELVDVPERFLAKQTLREGVKVASSVVQKDPKAGLEKLEDTARIDIALVGSDMGYCVPLGPTEPHLGLLRKEAVETAHNAMVAGADVHFQQNKVTTVDPNGFTLVFADPDVAAPGLLPDGSESVEGKAEALVRQIVQLFDFEKSAKLALKVFKQASNKEKDLMIARNGLNVSMGLSSDYCLDPKPQKEGFHATPMIVNEKALTQFGPEFFPIVEKLEDIQRLTLGAEYWEKTRNKELSCWSQFVVSKSGTKDVSQGRMDWHAPNVQSEQCIHCRESY
jgi:hypothetical protein